MQPHDVSGVCSTCGASMSGEVCVACAFAQALQPQYVGPYRLVARIGEGGMGEVWHAEQDEPLKRHVALKVIKAGMDTKHVLARFDAERQALAMMDHPCVAKVFDAGTTDEGRPFFVMELVDGLPITEHCDREAQPTAARLEMFARVCDGVQHAHQKAILHRDLKPTNVLVAEHDGVAVPKVIDFGLVKAMDRSLGDASMLTEAGVIIGTPAYMSPEQAEPGRDVDTRTDVYALGVMLYELLTGTLPFDATSVRTSGLDSLRKLIRESDPAKPSTRLARQSAEVSGEVADRRGVDAKTLRRQLAGELDWITMKALARERDRRYGSAGELAADVRRHLNREPVLAAPPSAGYQARKFVSRHRFGVAATVLAMAGLVAFGVTMSVQAARIKREAEAKKRVSQFMTQVFQVSDPSQARGNSITAREILDKGVARVRKDLADDPVVRGELMATMGSVYAGLGLYVEAEPLLEEALTTQRATLGPDHPETLRTQSEFARLLMTASRDKEAEGIVLDVIERQKRVLGSEHPDTIRSMGTLARTYWGLSRNPEGEAVFRDLIRISTRVFGPEHPETLRSKHGLGLTLHAQGRAKEAEATFTETLALRKKVLGPDHPQTINSMMHLANAYDALGRTKEGEALTKEVLEIGCRVYGPRYDDMVWMRVALAGYAMKDGRTRDALAYLEDAADNGLAEKATLLEEPQVQPLIGNPAFARILAKIDANAAAGKAPKP